MLSCIIPPYRFSSLSASIYCHTLVAILSISNGPEFLAYVSLIDGAIKQICQVSDGMHYLTSELEFISPTVCDNTLDLDCNDSSGATGANYNSFAVTCLMRQATVADEDVRMFYDAIISTMTIRVTGFVPDGLNEVIDITGSIPGIDVSGQGHL